MNLKNLIVICISLFGMLPLDAINATEAESCIRIAINPKNADSLRFRAFTKYYIHYHQQFPDSALKYAQIQLQLAQTRRIDKEIFKAYIQQGNILSLQKRLADALSVYKKAELIALKSDNPIMKADVFHNIGTVWVHQKDYAQAMNYYYRALDLYEASNDRGCIKMALSSMASVFLLIRNFDMAISQYEYILKLQKSTELKNRTTGIVLSNLGWSYYKKSNFPKAKSYYLRSLPIFLEQGSMFLAVSAYIDLSRIYYEMHDLDSAHFYVNKSIALSKELHNDEDLSESILHRGKILFENNPNLALTEVLPLIPKINSSDNLDLKRDLYELLYRSYKALGNTQGALTMHERFLKYHDSIQNQYFQFEIVQEAIKRSHQKQMDAAKLANQKALDALALRQFKINVGLIGASTLLIGILLYGFKRSRIKDLKRRDTLLGEIEHLKKSFSSEIIEQSVAFKLNRDAIEKAINRPLNETDWKVLNILFEDATISNKAIADKAYLSLDGIGSSLRRMYVYFDVKESKYKKIGLISQAIQFSKKH